MIIDMKNLAISLAIMILIPLLAVTSVSLILHQPLHPNRMQADYKKDPEKFSVALEKYNLEYADYLKLYFVFFIAIGLACIISGIFLDIPYLSMGLILGGTWCLVWGYFSALSILGNIGRMIPLLLALIFLTYASIKITKNKTS